MFGKILLILLSFIVLVGCSANKTTKKKERKIVVKYDEEANQDVSWSKQLNEIDIKNIADEVYNQVSSSKELENLKKEKNVEKLFLRFGNLKISVFYHGDNFLKITLKRRFLSLMNLVEDIPREEKTKGYGDEAIKPDLIFTGKLMHYEGNEKDAQYLFEYKLVNDKGEIVYTNKVYYKKN